MAGSGGRAAAHRIDPQLLCQVRGGSPCDPYLTAHPLSRAIEITALVAELPAWQQLAHHAHARRFLRTAGASAGALAGLDDARLRPASGPAQRGRDHRRHAARRPRVRQAGAHAEHRRARPAGAQLHALLPRGDADGPGAALDPERAAGVPVPRLASLSGPAGRAGLGADRRRAHHLHERPAPGRLLDRVRDRQHRRSASRRPGARSGAASTASSGAAARSAAPPPACRSASCATGCRPRSRTPTPATGCAATSPTAATRTTRPSRSPRACSATARAVLETRGAASARSALVVDTFEPHEPWTPPRHYIDMYGDPDYHGPEPARPYYAPVEPLPARAPRPGARRAHARPLRGRGDDDRPLAGRVPRPLPRARARPRHGGRARLGPRLLPGRLRLHRQDRHRAAPGADPRRR